VLLGTDPLTPTEDPTEEATDDDTSDTEASTEATDESAAVREGSLLGADLVGGIARLLTDLLGVFA